MYHQDQAYVYDYIQSSSEPVTERVLNVRSDQKMKNAFRERSIRFIHWPTFIVKQYCSILTDWTGDFCIHFGSLSIEL